MILAQSLSVTLTVSNYNGYNIPCFGGQNGSITATVTGGTPPYTYEWKNGEITATIIDLSALSKGMYYLEVCNQNNTVNKKIIIQ